MSKTATFSRPMVKMSNGFYKPMPYEITFNMLGHNPLDPFYSPDTLDDRAFLYALMAEIGYHPKASLRNADIEYLNQKASEMYEMGFAYIDKTSGVQEGT